MNRAEAPLLADLPAAVRALERALREVVSGGVGFSPGQRALYATDASHYRQPPIGVVTPRTVDELVAAVAVCAEHDVPILPRGAGTSLAGQGCNVAVVLDTSAHLNRILELDPQRRIARVQPGVVLDDLRAAAEAHALTFGPDPSTHAWCTMGGMVGNNACGVHSVMAGKTVDNVEALEVLTYDGARFTVAATPDDELARICDGDDRRAAIYRGLRELRDRLAGDIEAHFPRIPRRVSGFNLDELLPDRGFHVARALTGTEGTCAVTLEATLRLVPSPPARILVMLGYDDLGSAADQVERLMAHGPIGLEGTDGSLIANMRARGLEAAGLALYPVGNSWLMVEFGGDTAAQAREKAEKLTAELDGDGVTRSMALIEDRALMRRIQQVREAGVGASNRLPDGRDMWPGWEDAAVDPARLGNYLREFTALTERFGYRSTIYGHYGQGCIHTRLDFDLTTASGIATYRRFVEEAADLCVAYGGSLSGEHGDGHARAELLPKMYPPPIIEGFAEFKRLWDPRGRMNPGKVVAPLKLDDKLKLGAGYAPPAHDTHFAWPDDDRRFGRAVARCVGVGKCRRMDGGTMCPSFMVTRDEQHSTRGRAHLLFEMSEGRLPGGWRNEEVKQALDLCLACKGCKRDCPAGVDMASYKAEFLAHYYGAGGRRRSLQSYVFGWIHRWARLAEWAPWLANGLVSLPGIRGLTKWIAGIARQRPIPRFASKTFRREHGRREARANADNAADQPKVVLWPDTFNNHFAPSVLHAGVRVLEAAGFRVIIPPRLCCGRALYDHGMLPLARKLLQQAVRELTPLLADGTRMVALEPGCLSVFRDELRNWFPDDADARRVADSSLTLAEFLRDHAPDSFELPALDGRALFHGHCHHKAVMTTDADLDLLRETGLALDTPVTGCCGMAGAFGYDARHFAVSQAVGERVLLPAVRELPAHARIITDGFSCREQIAQLSDRRARHLAEVLAEALDSARERT